LPRAMGSGIGRPRASTAGIGAPGRAGPATRDWPPNNRRCRPRRADGARKRSGGPDSMKVCAPRRRSLRRRPGATRATPHLRRGPDRAKTDRRRFSAARSWTPHCSALPAWDHP
jgi:hypothetical protein